MKFVASPPRVGITPGPKSSGGVFGQVTLGPAARAVVFVAWPSDALNW